MDRGFLCADCDLSPERRICGARGSGIATYRELIRNLASKTSPEGGALPQVISRWLSSVQSEVAAGRHATLYLPGAAVTVAIAALPAEGAAASIAPA